VCRVLVEEIARAGNGTALFTSLEEELGEKVIDQLRDALHPSWTGKMRFEFKVNPATNMYILK